MPLSGVQGDADLASLAVLVHRADDFGAAGIDAGRIIFTEAAVSTLPYQ